VRSTVEKNKWRKIFTKSNFENKEVRKKKFGIPNPREGENEGPGIRKREKEEQLK